MNSQVEEVKTKNDIVQIIGEHIQLKKAGRNYKANCPFHNEKSPSFMVSAELQLFKCFGCGESGDVISFLEKYEGMEFYEALKYLADRAGVNLLPSSGGQPFSEKEHLFKANSLAAQFYHYILLKHVSGKKALQYLTEDRGLSLSTIKEFQLGFSPDVPLALKTFVIQKNKTTLQDLEKIGLIYLKNGQGYDRFRGRVIFPLHDHRGNIVGFSGRILPGTVTEMGKYINTPETLIYHKSRVLYGLHLSRSAIKLAKEAVIVEGELDMISSWQSGIKNVVAIKGSALTDDQTQLLRRFTERIVLALDADFAGDKAARRGIEIAESKGLEVSVAVLKDFKDPDEAARADPAKLKGFIKNSVGVWDFIIDSVFSRNDTDGSGTAKAKISKEIIPILGSIGDSIVAAHYSSLVAKRLGVPVEAVVQQIRRYLAAKDIPTAPISVVKKPEEKTRRRLLEERLVALLFLTQPEKFKDEDIKTQITDPVFLKMITAYQEHYPINSEYEPAKFIKELPAELAQNYSDLIFNIQTASLKDSPEEMKNEIDLVVREIRIIDIKTKIEEVVTIIQNTYEEKNAEKLQEAKKTFDSLTQDLKKLEMYEKKGIIF